MRDLKGDRHTSARQRKHYCTAKITRCGNRLCQYLPGISTIAEYHPERASPKPHLSGCRSISDRCLGGRVFGAIHPWPLEHKLSPFHAESLSSARLFFFVKRFKVHNPAA